MGCWRTISTAMVACALQERLQNAGRPNMTERFLGTRGQSPGNPTPGLGCATQWGQTCSQWLSLATSSNPKHMHTLGTLCFNMCSHTAMETQCRTLACTPTASTAHFSHCTPTSSAEQTVAPQRHTPPLASQQCPRANTHLPRPQRRTPSAVGLECELQGDHGQTHST